MIDEPAAFLGFDPQFPEFIQVMGFPQYPLNHFLTILIHRNQGVASFPAGEDESALPGDFHLLPFDLTHSGSTLVLSWFRITVGIIA